MFLSNPKSRWSPLVQERFRNKQCFKCGGCHKRPGPCDGPGPVILLSEHITPKVRVAKVQSSGGTKLDGYSLSKTVVTASEI
jgi:hypothetical protein